MPERGTILLDAIYDDVDQRLNPDNEECWHCGTPTPRGCGCFDCYDNAGYIPPAAAYHCKTCGRWWAWMTGLNITTITFGEEPSDA